MSICKEGYWFIILGISLSAIFLVFSLIFGNLWTFIVFIVGIIATFFITYFFRDPDRSIPQEKGAIVAPADGKIVGIEQVEDQKVGEAVKISIFMSLFDVHINRMPCDGEVISVEHRSGKFNIAFREDASKKNEKMTTILNTKIGKVKVVQIAGFVARRIVNYLDVDKRFHKGDKIGLICFGSRVDLFLPERKVEILVEENSTTKGGESRVASVK